MFVPRPVPVSSSASWERGGRSQLWAWTSRRHVEEAPRAEVNQAFDKGPC